MHGSMHGSGRGARAGRERTAITGEVSVDFIFPELYCALAAV